MGLFNRAVKSTGTYDKNVSAMFGPEYESVLHLVEQGMGIDAACRIARVQLQPAEYMRLQAKVNTAQSYYHWQD